jgi:hypothetical protein
VTRAEDVNSAVRPRSRWHCAATTLSPGLVSREELRPRAGDEYFQKGHSEPSCPTAIHPVKGFRRVDGPPVGLC